MPEVFEKGEFSKSQSRKKSANALNTIANTITGCVKEHVDTTKFLYSILKSDKKIEVGSLVVNVRIAEKDDPSNCKYLVFVINRDDKSGLIHTFILDGTEGQSAVLFSVTDRYPVKKLERYIPSIIRSTENMIG